MGFFKKLGQLWWKDEPTTLIGEPAQGGRKGPYAGPGPYGEEATPDYSQHEGFTGRIGLGGSSLDPGDADLFLTGEMTLFCDSTNVAYAKYFPGPEQLEIGFLNGGAYLYFEISLDEALTFLEAPSKGTWVWDNLRLRGSKSGHKKHFVKLH